MKEVRKDIYKELFSSKSGVVVHSSALCDGSDVYIFSGVSESGKSTVAQKLNCIMIPINDEKNVLEFTDRGVRVSTHFLKDEDDPKEYLVNENVEGYLKAFFFLLKEFEKTSYIEQINEKTYVWKMLLTCAGPPPTKKEDHLFSNYLEVIDRLTDLVPFYNFYHNLNDPPEYIAELLRKTI